MLLVPRSDGEFASVGTVAEVVDEIRIPGGGQRRDGPGPRRGIPGAAAHRRRRRAAGRGHHSRRRAARGEHVRELEREYRAVVEEILDLRGADARDARIPALDHRAGRAGRHLRLLARPQPRGQGRAAGDARRDRAPREGARSCSASAWRSFRSAARIRDDVQSGAEKQQREYFLRKQMESIRKELGEDEGSVVDEYRRKIEEAGMPEAVREQAEKELGAARADGRGLGRGLDDPHLPRLARGACRGRSARRSGSTRSTRARCWTPTTPASRTSRTGSPSTSPCASCGASAAWPRRAGPRARS